jgi:hypothetical protein
MKQHATPCLAMRVMVIVMACCHMVSVCCEIQLIALSKPAIEQQTICSDFAPAYQLFLNKVYPPQTRKKAVSTTMTTVNDHIAVPDDCTQKQVPKIKIPKWAWNSFEPPHHLPAHGVTRSTASTQMRTKPKTFTVHEDRDKLIQPAFNTLLHEEVSLTPFTQHRSCKTKLWAFHHGGPRRGVKGAMQNEITCESPCLQSTCVNCWKWHPHLVRGQYSVDELPSEEVQETNEADMEPLSLEVDPRILNNTWQDYTSRKGSAKSTASLALPDANGSPILTPVKSSFSHDAVFSELSLPFNHDIGNTPLDEQYSILLPSALAKQTNFAAPATSTWHYTLRQRHPVRLCFASHVGKQKFGELVVKREKKARKASYDRARRTRLQLMKNQIAGNH